ncbi:hypothetical protein WA158_002220 [Blastocystis sp. Blastoise]
MEDIYYFRFSDHESITLSKSFLEKHPGSLFHRIIGSEKKDGYYQIDHPFMALNMIINLFDVPNYDIKEKSQIELCEILHTLIIYFPNEESIIESIFNYLIIKLCQYCEYNNIVFYPSISPKSITYKYISQENPEYHIVFHKPLDELYYNTKNYTHMFLSLFNITEISFEYSFKGLLLFDSIIDWELIQLFKNFTLFKIINLDLEKDPSEEYDPETLLFYFKQGVHKDDNQYKDDISYIYKEEFELNSPYYKQLVSNIINPLKDQYIEEFTILSSVDGTDMSDIVHLFKKKKYKYLYRLKLSSDFILLNTPPKLIKSYITDSSLQNIKELYISLSISADGIYSPATKMAMNLIKKNIYPQLESIHLVQHTPVAIDMFFTPSSKYPSLKYIYCYLNNHYLIDEEEDIKLFKNIYKNTNAVVVFNYLNLEYNPYNYDYITQLATLAQARRFSINNKLIIPAQDTNQKRSSLLFLLFEDTVIRTVSTLDVPGQSECYLCLASILQQHIFSNFQSLTLNFPKSIPDLQKIMVILSSFPPQHLPTIDTLYIDCRYVHKELVICLCEYIKNQQFTNLKNIYIKCTESTFSLSPLLNAMTATTLPLLQSISVTGNYNTYLVDNLFLSINTSFSSCLRELSFNHFSITPSFMTSFFSLLHNKYIQNLKELSFNCCSSTPECITILSNEIKNSSLASLSVLSIIESSDISSISFLPLIQTINKTTMPLLTSVIIDNQSIQWKYSTVSSEFDMELEHSKEDIYKDIEYQKNIYKLEQILKDNHNPIIQESLNNFISFYTTYCETIHPDTTLSDSESFSSLSDDIIEHSEIPVVKCESSQTSFPSINHSISSTISTDHSTTINQNISSIPMISTGTTTTTTTTTSIPFIPPFVSTCSYPPSNTLYKDISIKERMENMQYIKNQHYKNMETIKNYIPTTDIIINNFIQNNLSNSLLYSVNPNINHSIINNYQNPQINSQTIENIQAQEISNPKKDSINIKKEPNNDNNPKRRKVNES